MNLVINGVKVEVASIIEDADLNNVDIDGGTIDDVTIGGSTPGPVSGTTGTFSGAVSAGLKTVECPATGSISAANLKGTRITNYGQSAENTQTLDTCAAELSFIVQIETAGAGAFHLKAAAGDKFYFDPGDGTVTALDDGDKISIATPAVGDTLVVNAIRTGASSYDWLAVCTRGTATDGGA